ncbi:DUF4178 domain-containing protein [Leptolyngbya sp. FACHB-36]|uniref:DUF4178 domain-containing protein n=1 Tax=Leptolyngbya sp. FACHB-36 TaxID=2692808 RepID=UPI001680D13D|nr:DUF4178 domain-containing protein [Leptolyngbya sp. FACHB-36]MBD2021381.1 DUF4178 domain-containing protein [Leptolyngbya sp. FACHB-36]
MADVITEDELRSLQSGDRVQYHGVHWQISDYSTYTDPEGYETEEWLMKSTTGKQYYLLRELDPQTPQRLVHWYLAEELRHPSIYEPNGGRDLVLKLSDEMRSNKQPYPELQLFNRIYQFESQTQGSYKSERGDRTRITWDYWDSAHSWNLALEAWSDNQLVVYSTREVQPADFSDIRRGAGISPASFSSTAPSISSGFPTYDYGRSSEQNTSRSIQLVIAWFITILGFFLMVSGI